MEIVKSIKNEDEVLEASLAKWRDEQYKVASEVLILDDPSTDTDIPSSVSATMTGRFKAFTPSDKKSESYYGGVDVSFPSNPEDLSVAVYTILRGSDQKVVYHDKEYFRLQVPYVSSYLSFREIDPLERLVKKQLNNYPELTPYAILVDGNGILHERKAGIACFLGVRTGIRTIGVGKTLYCQAGLEKELVERGIDEALVDILKWSRTQKGRGMSADETPDKNLLQGEGHPIIIDQIPIDASKSSSESTGKAFDDLDERLDRDVAMKELAEFSSGLGIKLKGNDGTVWAAALLGHGGKIKSRSKSKSSTLGTKKPIFVSVGHLISLEEAVKICAELSSARIPEPVRQADLSGRELLREQKPDN